MRNALLNEIEIILATNSLKRGKVAGFEDHPAGVFITSKVPVELLVPEILTI